MSHPVISGLLPAVPQSVGCSASFGRAVLWPLSHTAVVWVHCSSAACPSVTAPEWKGPQRALTLSLWGVRDQPQAGESFPRKLSTARGARGVPLSSCAHSCKTHQQGSVYGLESVSLCHSRDPNSTDHPGPPPHHRGQQWALGGVM